MDTLFSDDDRRRIADAIEAAEANTSCEIVPYVVLRSHAYEAVPWRGGMLGGLMALVIVGLGRTAPIGALGWLATDTAALLLVLSVGGLGALAATTVPTLIRLFAGSARMDNAVYRRALQAFVEEEIFSTRDRTGILLFVSLLERRIEVLVDAGIYSRVDGKVWQDVAARVRDGIESGQLAQGLIDAIHQCGRLLTQHGFGVRPDDRDELPSHLRTGEES